jgi:hypothetical protein
VRDFIQRIPDEQKKALLDMHPIKRLGISEDVHARLYFRLQTMRHASPGLF